MLAEGYIDSSVAAVLIATMPIWLATFDAVLSRRWPSGLVIGGLVAGIVGVAILLIPGEGVDQLNPLGIGLCDLRCRSPGPPDRIYARRAPLPRSQLLATGTEMLAGGIMLFAAGTLLGEIGRTNVEDFSLRSVVALAYLIMFGSIIAFTAYTWLLANVPVSTVGTYAYVNPIVAVALGAVFL